MDGFRFFKQNLQDEKRRMEEVRKKAEDRPRSPAITMGLNTVAMELLF